VRPLLPALAAVIFAGCSLLSPPQPEPTKAALTRLPDVIPHEHPHAVTLVVLVPMATATYDTTRMAYSERPYQIGYFRDHEWAEPPTQMIHKLLIQTLEQTGYFRSILSPPDIAPGGYTLRTELLQLVQDHSSSTPVLRLGLRAELLGPSGQPLGTTDIEVQERIAEKTPYAGVIAANSALANALLGVAQFVLAHVR
jgi:cholesterol transport system auxiliary component